ncbi:MAG: mandelate racemase/muconate lactonizing enzyme family protein [Bryobacteraceae bacterium]
MKITAVEATPIFQVVRPDVAIISAAGSHPNSRYVIVTIRSDDGATGHGEATVVAVWSGETQQSALHAIREIIAPRLIGQDPRNIGALAGIMDRVLQGNPFTKAAVEMALLDLVGKKLGLPAYMLFGGPRRPPEIRLRFSIGAFAPDEAVRVALAAVAKGARAVKVKVGLDPAIDVARVAAVRSAVGEGFRVAVDANCGWNESDTLWAIPHLERLGISAIEQPIARGNFRGCARLRKRTNIPIMLDESIFTREDALEAIRQEACDLISVYPGKNGGVLRSLEIAQMAETAGLRCTIGSNLETDLGTAAMLQLAIAMPALAAEVDHDVIGPLYYDTHPTNPPIQYREGYALVPDGPGFGVELITP